MKKRNNKILALLLAMTMCGTAMAGCGSSEKSSEVASTETTTSTETTVATEPVAEEPLKNVDIYPLTSDKTFTIATQTDLFGEKDYNAYTAAMEKGTGISVDWKYMAEDQLSLALTSKEFPDAIFLYPNIMDKATVYEYGQAGYFVNFIDYLDIMPNFSAFLEKYPDVYEQAQNEDGSIYSLPMLNSSNTGSNNLLYYRTDMMKEIGWENPPATTEEFLQFIIELQEHYGAKDPDFIAFNAYQPSHMTWTAQRLNYFLFAAMGELVSLDLTIDSKENVVLGAATEQYKLYLDYMNKIWESGAFNTNIYSQEAAASQALNAGNHVAVTSAFNGLTMDNFTSDEMEVAVLEPLTSEHWDKQQFYLAPAYTFNRVSVLSTSCEDVETMVKWFDAWYSTPENPLNEEGTIWGSVTGTGELGVDWDFDAETNVMITYPNEKSGKSFGAALYNGYENGRMPYTQGLTTTVGVKGQGTVNNLWPYAVTPYPVTSLVLTQDESDIYNDAWTDIKAYIAENTAKFITGELKVAENWDTYVSDLQKMGLQDVIDVYQAAYDRTVGK